MARVEVSRTAAADLDRLVRTHSLPKNTKQRFKGSVRRLALFPKLGPELAGRWSGFRFVLGPWRWMLVVYVYIEDEDRVVIVTVQDARTSFAARSGS
ncbi:MAG TPA: type II toxin-antitoxin system RelE/ParE family toxin [Candidatus Dormibacteraeota bacterium]|nr:type II toxin-antitoxin system RelE/ParE family toxin [Candidatus Dormibacteraeota bacterium]